MTGTTPPALGGKLLTHLKIVAKCFSGDSIVTVDEGTAEFLILSKASPSGEASLIDTVAVLDESDPDEPHYEFEWNPADSVQLRAVLDAAADPTAPVELRYEFRFERDGNKGCIGGPIYFLNNFFRPETPAPEATLNTSWETLKSRVLAGTNLTRAVDDEAQTMTFAGEDSEANAAAIAAHIADLANPHAVSFAQLGSKPTTLSGYGITDALTDAQIAAGYSPLGHTHAFGELTGKPTTLSGYGITDALTAAAIAATYQPLNGNLTSIAALTTTSYGRGLLTLANVTALRTAIDLGTAALQDLGTGSGGGADFQKIPYFDSSGNLTISSSFVGDGSALTGLSKSQVGLGSVENTALSTWVGSTNLTTLGTIGAGTWQGSVIAPAYLGSGSGITGKFLRGDGTWQAVSSGLTIGSTAITGGTSGRLLTSGAALGELTLGSGVAAWLATPSSASLAAALTDETGTGAAVFGTGPTIKDTLRIVKTGNESELAGFEVVTDPLNGGVRALYILPPANSGRIYFGKSGQALYSLNFGYVSGFESCPAIVFGSGLTVASTSNTFINRGGGGTEIGANHPTGYGLDVYQDNSFNSAVIGHRALNVHRSDGLTLFGVSTTRTSWEGINLAWDGTRYNVKPVAGSGGGTVRTAAYYTTGSVFWASGSGSPEGVVTAPVGSLYTRTDGGSSTTLYVKESGSGDTGWAAK